MECWTIRIFCEFRQIQHYFINFVLCSKVGTRHYKNNAELPGLVVVHRGTKDERDRCQKSYRCVAVEYLDVVIERVCRSGSDLIGDGGADNLLLSESMALEFPLSHRSQLVDIYGCRCSSLIDHVT